MQENNNKMKEYDRSYILHQQETIADLESVLYRTRSEVGGISLRKIAEVMVESFDEAELSAIVREIKYLKDTK